MKLVRKSLAFMLILMVCTIYTFPTAVYADDSTSAVTNSESSASNSSNGNDSVNTSNHSNGSTTESNSIPNNTTENNTTESSATDNEHSNSTTDHITTETEQNNNTTTTDTSDQNSDTNKNNATAEDTEKNNDASQHQSTDNEQNDKNGSDTTDKNKNDQIDPSDDLLTNPNTVDSAIQLPDTIQLEKQITVPKEIELKDLNVVFKNDGNIIGTEDVIDPKKSMEIVVNFNIPNHEISKIKKDDFSKINLALSDELQLEHYANTSVILNIEDGDTLEIGTLGIKDNMATITYNDAFTKDDNTDLVNVKAHFSLSLTLDESAMGDHTGDQITVTILGQSFKISLKKNPHADLAKKGTTSLNGIITWKVDITPNKDLIAKGTLDGYTLTDTLPKDQVKYIDSSFTVNGVTESGVTYNEEEGILTYTFDNNAVATKTAITYQTQILNLVENNNKTLTIKNNAKIENTELEDSATTSATTSYTPKWIVKNGTYEAADQKISWTLKVNESGYSLKEAVVTDPLDSILRVEESTIKLGDTLLTMDPTNTPYYEIQTSTVDGKEQQTLKIFLGDINDAKKITFKTSLTAEASPYQQLTLSNTATLSWSSLAGEGTEDSISGKSNNVTVGINAIKKEAKGYDRSTHEISWKVTVNERKVEINDAKAVDYFVYREDGKVVADETNVLNKVKTNYGKDIFKVAYNEKYAGSFSGDGEVSVVTETIIVGNQELKVDIVTVFFHKITDAKTFQFHTEVMAKSAYSVNKTTDFINTIYLYDGTNLLTSAQATQPVISWVLDKNCDSGIPTYNYETRETTWRLHVNANLMEINNAIVVDQLPQYCDISGELTSCFEVYECTQRDGDRHLKINNASLLTSNEVGQLLVPSRSVANDGKVTVTFTFHKTIEKGKGYIIKLRTKITDEGVQKIFGNAANINKTITIRNNASISGEEIYNSPNDWEDIKINNTILEKTGIADPDTGTILWRIDVNSNLIDLATLNSMDQAFVVDEIPSYMEPLMKNNQVDLKVWEMSTKQNGVWSPDQALDPATVQSFLSYQDHTLRFQLPDPKRSYRLEFETKVTNQSVSEISNSAYLEGMKQHSTSNSNKISIKDLTAGGSAQRIGKLNILKVEEHNEGIVLSGAAFSLYAVDKDNTEELVSTAITDEDGLAQFKPLTTGDYIVKETAPPVGYELGTITEQAFHIDTTKKDQRNISLTFKNPRKETPIEPMFGKLTVLKVKEGDHNVTLSGAAFTLYQVSEDGSEKVVSNKTTSADGTATFEGLVTGDYMIREITPPSGYEFGKVTEQAIHIDTADENTSIIKVTFENPVKGESENPEPTPDPELTPVTPPSGGHHRPSNPDTVTDIPDNEIPAGEAPSAPQLTEEEISIPDDEIPAGPIPEEEIIIQDEPIPAGPMAIEPTLPKTGGLAAMYFYGLGTLLTGLGVMLKRKNKSN